MPIFLEQRGGEAAAECTGKEPAARARLSGPRAASAQWAAVRKPSAASR